MKKHVLITGHKGMLGQELVRSAEERKWKVTGFDLPEQDITRREDTVRFIREAKPDLIVHSAAFTKVDDCESQPDLAFRVNAIGTQNVCLAAQELAVPVVYLSTDYVFDGTKEEPYDEWDAPHPLSVYGKSKYAGECFVRWLCPKHFIVRTSWLCGSGGPNFVETILRLARERDEIKVVNDQHGSPTFTFDLAPAIMELAETGAFGTYHITNRGYTTWYGFARKIVELAGLKTRVLPCTTGEFPRPAPRPKNSRLADRMYTEVVEQTEKWEKGLSRYFELRQ